MTDPGASILVVDDDSRLRRLLGRYLAANGFQVFLAADAGEARAALARGGVDLLVLDVMLPGESGFDLVASLKLAGSEVPVILLTARGDPEDRITGLELGAEDYLAKPFEPRELLLRMQTVLRRRAGKPDGRGRTVRFGRFAFDPDQGLLTADGAPVRLTPTEASLLAALAARAGETLSRDELADAGACGPAAGARTVDVQVTRLRRKIEDDPKFPRYLQTAWGRGYLLRAD